MKVEESIVDKFLSIIFLVSIGLNSKEKKIRGSHEMENKQKMEDFGIKIDINIASDDGNFIGFCRIFYVKNDAAHNF